MIVLWKLGHCDIVCNQRHQLNLYGKISSTTLFYIFYILGRVCKIPVKNSCTLTDDGQLTKCHSHTYVMYQQVCPLFFNCTNSDSIELTQRNINMKTSITSTREIPSDDEKPLATIQYINTKPILTTTSRPSSTINRKPTTTTILTEPTTTTILTEPTNSKPILTTTSKPSSTINTNRPTTTILKETTNSTSTIYLIVIVIMLVCLIVLIIIIVCKIKLGGNSSLINQAFEMSSF